MPDIWQPLALAQSFLSRGAGKKCSELQIEWEQLPLIITTLCFFRPIIVSRPCHTKRANCPKAKTVHRVHICLLTPNKRTAKALLQHNGKANYVVALILVVLLYYSVSILLVC